MRTGDLELFVRCMLVLGVCVGKALVLFFQDEVCETGSLLENGNALFSINLF
jgi:hypothetical protein